MTQSTVFMACFIAPEFAAVKGGRAARKIILSCAVAGRHQTLPPIRHDRL
jgi:hypothetical protein